MPHDIVSLFVLDELGYIVKGHLIWHCVFVAGDIEMIRLVSNVERQQQRNAPPTATPRSDSQREQPPFSLKEIQGRIQSAYRLPTPTINVNVSSCALYISTYFCMHNVHERVAKVSRDISRCLLVG